MRNDSTKWYNWTGDAAWDEYCFAGSIIIGIALGLILLLVIAAVTA